MSGGLTGKTIVNTRATHQAEAFNHLIRKRGGIPVSFPCITIQPPGDTSELDAALELLVMGVYDWLLLTSANTVYSLAQQLGESLLEEGQRFKVAAIGPATAQAAQEQLGLTVDLIPDDHIAEALAQAVLAQEGKQYFLPESAIAQPILQDHLRAGDAEVDVVVAYQTVCGSWGTDLYTQAVDVVTFTSSSTVQCFVERTQDDPSPLDEVLFACIGPKTARTAQDYGFSPVIVPQTYTLDAMLDAIEHELVME